MEALREAPELWGFAPRWRLDPGDAGGLEASADLVLAALARGQKSTDAGAAAAARWTVAEVWAPAGLDPLVARVTPPASPLPPPAASLSFAAPPPPRRPRAPLELVVCRARDARRCVRHMRRDLHCCAGCVDDPLAAYVRKTFAAPVRDRDAVQALELRLVFGGHVEDGALRDDEALIHFEGSCQATLH